MDEKNLEMSAEEKLKQLNDERKTLKAQVLSEREIRLKEAAEMRVKRDKQIENIQVNLKNILDIIFAYNKLGKVAKVDYDIFGKISEEISEEINYQNEISVESTTSTSTGS